jgi:hypothetical protein
MTTLEFQDREPAMGRAGASESQVFAGNRSFYERLQGQTKKSATERYGWIAVPVAVVAIIGVAAATSIPHETAKDVAGGPGPSTASASTPAPAKPATPPALNEAQANNDVAQTPEEAALSGKAAATAAQSPAAAPAPVKVARKAPAATSTRAAAAVPAERAAPAAETPATPPAPTVQAPAPSATEDAAPQPAAPAPPASDASATQAQPSQSAPADTPAQ